MRFPSLLLIISGLCFVGALVVIFIPPHFQTETCITGTFEVSQWDGEARLIVGNQSLCGVGLHFTSISGPVRSKGD